MFLCILNLLLSLPVAFAAFGVTTSGTNMVVDSGAGLVTTSEWLSIVKTCHRNADMWVSQYTQQMEMLPLFYSTENSYKTLPNFLSSVLVLVRK